MNKESFDSVYQCTRYVAERQGNQVVTFDLHVGPSAASVLFTKTAAVSSLSVTTAGSGYTSTPTVAITAHGTDDALTGVTGAQATADAVVTSSGGVVDTITVTDDGGGGYTMGIPTVSFSGGGGSGAAATAVLTLGSVTSITIVAGGSGYSSAPTITISDPLTGDPATATATVTALSQTVTSLTITSSGAGYTSAPTVSFSGGRGTGAAASATLATLTAPVKSVTVDDHTHGYDVNPPGVTFNGGAGSGAAGTAVLTTKLGANILTSVTMTNNGSGYTSAPSVFFDSPDTIEFPIDLHEPLRIDKLSDVYLDSFTTFNCVVPTTTSQSFVMEIKEFQVHSHSNNQGLSFGRVVIPNNGAALSGGSTGVRVHKGSKFNYICPVNPMTLHRLTIKLTLLDGQTSIFLSPANGHRCFGELLIVPRAS